jgi:S1-C subfamily serine protease
MSKTEGSRILQSLSEAIVGVAADVSPHVVSVSSGHSGGTGVVWTEEGHILTASHVVGRVDAVEVRTSDGESLEGKVVGRDRETDIAVVKIEKAGLSPIEKGDSDGLKVGEFVMAFANPSGKQTGLTSGILTSLKGSIGGHAGGLRGSLLLTDARLNPGYSGGPLVDVDGRMVGLDVAYFAQRGVAIPVNAVKKVADQLMMNGHIRRAFMGIVTESLELPEELAKRADLEQPSGMLVMSVEPESPARKAGIALGDVILGMGGSKVEDHSDLRAALSEEAIGKEMEVKLLRSEALTKVKIVPEEAPY